MNKLSNEEKLKIVKNKCQLIVDIGFDYDGYRKAEDLMGLIDELVEYSKDCIKLLESIKKDEQREFRKSTRKNSRHIK